MARNERDFSVYRYRNGVYYVRFRHAGHRENISTRTRDRAEARVRAARIYAKVVSDRRTPERKGPAKPLSLLMGEWLAAIEPPVISKEEWQARELRCRVHLLPYFESVDQITTRNMRGLPERALARGGGIHSQKGAHDTAPVREVGLGAARAL